MRIKDDQDESRFHWVAKSANSKTGAIPVTYSSKKTCPDCPFKRRGCYADNYHVSLVWEKVTDGRLGTSSVDEICDKIAAIDNDTLWRWNIAGDLPGDGKRINRAAVRKITKANRGKRGFTFTHHKMTAANLATVREAVEGGFNINLSANSPDHADELATLGLPVVTVVASGVTENFVTKGGNRVVICPATQREDTTCKTCGLCARRRAGKGGRAIIIGFPAHGTRTKMANQVVIRFTK